MGCIRQPIAAVRRVGAVHSILDGADLTKCGEERLTSLPTLELESNLGEAR